MDTPAVREDDPRRSAGYTDAPLRKRSLETNEPDADASPSDSANVHLARKLPRRAEPSHVTDQDAVLALGAGSVHTSDRPNHESVARAQVEASVQIEARVHIEASVLSKAHVEDGTAPVPTLRAQLASLNAEYQVHRRNQPQALD